MSLLGRDKFIHHSFHYYCVLYFTMSRWTLYKVQNMMSYMYHPDWNFQAIQEGYWCMGLSVCHLMWWELHFQQCSVALATAMFIFWPHCRKCDPYQIWIIYISSWPHFQGDSESGHQNFEIRTIFILQPHFGKCDPYQIWTIYISFWSHFQGDSESGHGNLKFTLFLSFSHIAGNVTPTKYGQSIYHSDHIFKEILNLAIKIWNSLCGTCHTYFSVRMIYRPSSFGIGAASATEWISNFGGQIRNLLENVVGVIYRPSSFGKGHISRNVAEG
jgi:hypothetical protein